MDIPLLPIPGGHLDLIRGQAAVDGTVSSLSSIEVAVLSVLADAAGEPVTEEELLARAWGYKTTKTRTVSMGISRLRHKVEQDPKSPQVVLTVRGVGYRLVLAPLDPVAPPTPTQVPLLGREREQQQVLTALLDGRPVELVGPGGVGTSTLARAVAGEGARVVTLRGVQRPETLIRRLCDALGVEGADGAALVKKALAGADALVLDAAESLDDDALDLLRELAGAAGGPLLLTSRRPLDVGQRVMVGPLDPDASLAVLQQARLDAGLPLVDPALAAPVLAEVGGFPLGLVLAAPLVELAADGTPLGLSTDPEGELVTVLRETLALCSDDERRLLALASAFAVPAGLDALTGLAGRSRVAVLRALHGLRERGLVQLAQGVVDVPVAVAAVAATTEAREAHARWAGALVAEPLVLREHRHELEAALDACDGDLLPHVLMRHFIVLYTYGPRERVDAEVLSLLPRVDSPGRRQVLLGAALQHGGDWPAAHDAYVHALELLPDSDPTFRGWAWLYRSVLATWLHDYDDAQASVEPILALRDQVNDRALWASLTLNTANRLATTDVEEAVALFKEVDAHAAELPSMALTALFHRIGIEAPSSASVRYVEKLLERVGEERLGPRRWGPYWFRVGRSWLRAGDTERGLALLHAHLDAARTADPGIADEVLAMAMMSVLHQPAVAREVQGMLGDRNHLLARLAGWYLDGAHGPPPTDDPRLAAVWEAVRDGRPVEVGAPWSGLTRALAWMQAATVPRGPA